ncbi:MAG: sigma-54-dependent Fis family transcriptional regulator [Acidobacteria bacterium]|nr:sigma-54-dependent Fis family transcriptional regulator [Acidobacteriota bacterium]
MNRKEKILIVDDEPDMQEVLETLLKSEGYLIDTASSGKEALSKLSEEIYDLVILDVMMPEMDGIETLTKIKEEDPEQVVIMITAYASVENAIAAMRKGAFDYITRPFRNEEIILTIKRALEQKRLTEENRALRRLLREKYSFHNIIGKNKKMLKVFRLIEQAAPSKSTILIQGESGTGKELVAVAIHQLSPRANKRFVVVNSGNVPPDLLESNLFGHVKGAFTGAVTAKKGLFEVANGGSIFFDEIGTISLETQAKLLRVIQEKEFMRLGGVETIKVDVRIIAATNVDLKKAVEKGEFREDLYYRINVITIELPPLRERKDDIPLLVRHFIDKYSKENNKEPCEITERALECLINYNWPGNVRELENVIERAVVLNTKERIDINLLPHYIVHPKIEVPIPIDIPPEGISFREVVDEFKKTLIVKSLQMAGGVQKKAADLLKLKPTTLSEMIKRYGITNEES